MISRRLTMAISVVALVGLSSATWAQQTKTTAQKGQSSKQQTETPTLEGILQRLQENVDQYQALVPSFFCDEHVVASMGNQYRVGVNLTVTDSNFRLKRVPNPDGTITLQESHEVKKVNGRPATGDSVSGPAFLRGAFSNGLALVSANQQACMRATIKPIRQNKPSDPITIQFASVPASERPADCLMQEDISGRVFIDPATMQIRRMEFHAPNHVIAPESKTSQGVRIPSAVGTWDVTVEYAPVVLGGESFWLPTKTSETMIDRIGTNEWLYDAAYRNYHKLEVTSRILPASETPVP